MAKAVPLFTFCVKNIQYFMNFILRKFYYIINKIS
nr:MAG TPA: hypothetical protein [Caudoviricetes sp.]